MVRLLENEREAANRVAFPPSITAVLFSLTLRSAIMESDELSP
jgi:hypothetical protein